MVSRNEERLKIRRIKAILRKEVGERNGDELEFLHRYSKVASEILRRKEKKKILDERTKEVCVFGCMFYFYFRGLGLEFTVLPKGKASRKEMGVSPFSIINNKEGISLNRLQKSLYD